METRRDFRHTPPYRQGFPVRDHSRCDVAVPAVADTTTSHTVHPIHLGMQPTTRSESFCPLNGCYRSLLH